MAFKAAKDAWIMMDGVNGAGTNVSGYADNFMFPQPVDTIEVSVFGTAAKQFVAGLTDGGQISASGPADTAFAQILSGVKAAQAAGSSTSTVVYAPFGSVSGQFKVSAEVWVSQFQLSTGVGGRVEYTSSLQVTGAVTNATW